MGGKEVVCVGRLAIKWQNALSTVAGAHKARPYSGWVLVERHKCFCDVMGVGAMD